MTRKRSGKTLVQTLTNTCQCCYGSGFIKSVATETYAILRKLRLALMGKTVGNQVELHVNQAVFEHITKLEYNAILALEKTYVCKIMVVSSVALSMNQCKIEKK